VSVKPTNQTATLINVASSITSVTIFSANSTSSSGDRRIIFNDSTATLFYAYSATPASTTAFTGKLAPAGFALIEDYSGPITGIWDAANGFARTTEW
jgi:hypothetical protein